MKWQPSGKLIMYYTTNHTMHIQLDSIVWLLWQDYYTAIPIYVRCLQWRNLFRRLFLIKVNISLIF